MRKTVNKEIIENSLAFHRNPIYNTGKEFCENLKFLLSIVYFQRFDYLGKLREKKVEDYISYYKDQAFTMCGVLKFNENYVEQAKAHLPKELDVTRVDVSSALKSFPGGLSWNDITPDEGFDAEKMKPSWQTIVNTWTSLYDTTIANYKSQLEYCQKSISSLRKKGNTFDSMSSNFRNKAYTIYNKIVNKIN